MKRLLLFVLLSGVALAAAANPAGSSVEVRGTQIQVPATAYPILPGEFDTYAGKYDLSNGETMVLRREGRRMFAEVGQRPAKELIATDHNAFVALDGHLKMTLDEYLGHYTGELLITVPRAVAGSAGGDEVRLISLR